LNTEAFVEMLGFEPGAIKDRQQEVMKDLLDYSDSVERMPFGTVTASARRAGWDGQGGRTAAEQHLVNRKVEGIRAMAEGTKPKKSFTPSNIKYSRPTNGTNPNETTATNGTNPNETTATNAQGLASWLDEKAPGFLRDVDIQIVNVDGLPGHDGGTWFGAYKDGTIYINSDTTTEADIEQVVFHEALGHGLAKQLLGPKGYREAMETIMKDMKRIQMGGKDTVIGDTTIGNIMETYTNLIDEKGNINPDMAEEVWAHYIEAHSKGVLNDRGVLFKIYEALKDMIRRAAGINTIDRVNAEAARAVRLARFNNLSIDGMRSGDALSVGNDIRYSKPVGKRDLIPEEYFDKRDARLCGIAIPNWLNEKLASFIPAPGQEGKISDLDLLLRPPQALVGDHVELNAMLREMHASSDKRADIANELSSISRDFTSHQNQLEVDNVSKVIIKGDIEGVEYATAGEAGLNATEFGLYQSVRKSFDRAGEILIADSDRALALMEDKVKGQANISPILEKAMADLRELPNFIRDAKGYFPRVRPQDANYEIQFIDRNGRINSEYVKGAKNRGFLNTQKRLAELKAQGATDIKISNRPMNFFDVVQLSPAETGEMQNIVVDLMADAKGELPEGLDQMIQSIFYARNFKRHFLRRKDVKGLYVNRSDLDSVDVAPGTTILEDETDPASSIIHGYQTTKLGEVIFGYQQALAGMSSKAELNNNLTEIFTKKDPETGKPVFDPTNRNTLGEYKLAKRFLTASSRSKGMLDKVVRRAGSLMYHVHIGGRLSSGIWNTMHVHMFGASTLRTLMKKQGMEGSLPDLSRQFVTAHKDAGIYIWKRKAKKNGGPVTMKDMGWTTVAQSKLLNEWNNYFAAANGSTLTQEHFSGLAMNDNGLPSKLLGKAAKFSGFFMHNTELANKLASFKVHYENMGNDTTEARAFVRTLNGSYEEWNMPGYLQGQGVGTAVLRVLTNTFRTHVRNTYELMIMQGKHDKAALGYTFGAAMVFAGLPGKELLEQMANMIWGKGAFDGDMDLWMKQNFGEAEAKIIRSGLTSYLLDIDAGRSLGIGPPPAIDALAFITGKSTDSALMSPINGMIKAVKGEQPIYKLMPIKSIQSVLQAAYEGDISPIGDGQVKLGSRKIFNSDGTPMKLTPWEQIALAAGLNPMRRSDVGREIWSSYQVKSWFNNWKSDIFDDAQNAHSLPERSAVNARMKEFNDTLRRLKRQKTYREVVVAKPISWADTKRDRNRYKVKD